MLRRLISAFLTGLFLAMLAQQLLCDAPNPTLANPAYCGQRGWMTSLSAFMFGAGLMWLFLLRRARTGLPQVKTTLASGASSAASPADASPETAELPLGTPPAPTQDAANPPLPPAPGDGPG